MHRIIATVVGKMIFIDKNRSIETNMRQERGEVAQGRKALKQHVWQSKECDLDYSSH